MTNNDNAKHILKSLAKLAKKDSQMLSINELRIIVAIEGLVARLLAFKGLSKHLVFKGGFVLLKVLAHDRFTRDLDSLVRGITLEEASDLVVKAIEVDLDDGLWFGLPEVESLDEQGEYGGLRISAAFQIGEPPPTLKKKKKLSRVNIDLGFGDTVKNVASEKLLSIVDGGTSISWSVYPIEWIISEKLQTLVRRGSANSRAKDLYDLVKLLPLCIDHEKLWSAIKATFKTRETEIPESFERFLSELDPRILMASWPSITLLDTKMTFEECIAQLLRQLKKLDGQLM